MPSIPVSVTIRYKPMREVWPFTVDESMGILVALMTWIGFGLGFLAGRA